MTADQRKREQIKHRKRNTQEREKGTLAKLMSFKSKLASSGRARGQPARAAAGVEDEAGEDHRLSYPAAWRVSDYIDGADDDDELGDWRHHKLEFKQERKAADPMARTEDVDDYVVEDPLLERGKAAFNAAQQRRGRNREDREWNHRGHR